MFDAGYAGTEGFPARRTSMPHRAPTPIQLINDSVCPHLRLTPTSAPSRMALLTAKGVPFAQLRDLGSRSFTIGGSNYTFQNNGQVTITNVIPSSSNSTFPVLGEPLNVTVDGKNFFTNQGSISVAPQVAWATADPWHAFVVRTDGGEPGHPGQRERPRSITSTRSRPGSRSRRGS